MVKIRLIDFRFYFALVLLLVLAPPGSGAQSRKSDGEVTGSPASDVSLSDAVRQMQMQIQQLQAATQEMKEEAARYRAETLELKQELEVTRQKLDSMAASSAGSGATLPDPHPSAKDQPTDAKPAGGALSDRVADLEEEQQVLSGKIDDQYQTKVESGSKYRVKLSGLLLMNVFSNNGNVDHIEVPSIALPANPSDTSSNTGGSFGATFRQSEVGLEVYGPTFAGAKTRGNFVADFFGEPPETNNGASSGDFKLRTGIVALDWDRTSLVAGVDDLFFSPLYATSYASLGLPAFSYTGNLWSWVPQVRIEHRLLSSENSTLTLSTGILDPLTGEDPQNEFLRVAGAGESSRQPGYGGGLEWRRRIFGQTLILGIGGYYNREDWGVNHRIDGWVSTSDWSIPFGEHFSLSGKFYDGNAIGGLGAGIGRSIDFNGILSEPSATVKAIGSIGGWSQFKFKPNAKFEFNIAAGQDTADAGDVRGFMEAPGYIAANLDRNRSEFGNIIYRPRSNLLFSTEFRTLRTYMVDGGSVHANQLNLSMGVLF